jgi:hypothetical protein
LLCVVVSLFEQARAASDAARGFADEDAAVDAAREPPFAGADAAALSGPGGGDAEARRCG